MFSAINNFQSCGLFDRDVPCAPSVSPHANDYFSMNEHPTYSCAVGGPSATLPDDMHVETAQEIPTERVRFLTIDVFIHSFFYRIRMGAHW